MNMSLLAVVTPPQAIFCGLSTRKKLWEENFTPANMTSCGRCNVKENREINNGEKYIILDVSSNIDCLYKRKVTY